jgi:hypothetical protein
MFGTCVLELIFQIIDKVIKKKDLVEPNFVSPKSNADSVGKCSEW